MIKAINLWLQRSSVTCGGTIERDRERRKRDFLENCGKRLPRLGLQPHLRAYTPAERSLEPTARFQHLQARTATPASAPGNFRVPGVYASQAEAGVDQDQGYPSPSSPPFRSVLGPTIGLPFHHFMAESDQIESGKGETPKPS